MKRRNHHPWRVIVAVVPILILAGIALGLHRLMVLAASACDRLLNWAGFDL